MRPKPAATSHSSSRRQTTRLCACGPPSSTRLSGHPLPSFKHVSHRALPLRRASRFAGSAEASKALEALRFVQDHAHRWCSLPDSHTDTIVALVSHAAEGAHALKALFTETMPQLRAMRAHWVDLASAKADAADYRRLVADAATIHAMLGYYRRAAEAAEIEQLQAHLPQLSSPIQLVLVYRGANVERGTANAPRLRPADIERASRARKQLCACVAETKSTRAADAADSLLAATGLPTRERGVQERLRPAKVCRSDVLLTCRMALVLDRIGDELLAVRACLPTSAPQRGKEPGILKKLRAKLEHRAHGGPETADAWFAQSSAQQLMGELDALRSHIADVRMRGGARMRRLDDVVQRWSDEAFLHTHAEICYAADALQEVQRACEDVDLWLRSHHLQPSCS